MSPNKELLVKKNRFLTVVAFSVLALVGGSAQAGLVINLSQQTINGSTAVVAAYSGSLDLSSITRVGTGSIGNNAPYHFLDVNAGAGALPLHWGSVNWYSYTPRSDFGVGGPVDYVMSPLLSYRRWTTNATLPLALSGVELGISSAYNWNDPISGTTEFLTTTYADWGVTPGSSRQVTINGTSETVTINIAPVPEIDPAGMGSVLALVTGALGLLERRRLKTA